MQMLYPIIFGLIFGYIIQRSRFCFAACFRDIFLIRNTAQTRAVLVALFINTLSFALVHFFTAGSLGTAGRVYPVGVHTLVGGLFFGFGMVIAGSCLSGCLTRIGEGNLMQIGTLFGLLLGSLLGAWHLNWWLPTIIASTPTIFLPDVVGWQAAQVLQLSIISLLYFTAAKYGGAKDLWSIFKQQGKIWPYGKGAVYLALANTMLFALWHRSWGISSGLTHLAGGLAAWLGLPVSSWQYFQHQLFRENTTAILLKHPIIYLALAMVLGSFVASVRHHEFRLRKPRTNKYYYSALVGGIMMGYGSRLALGCNIGALLTGIASLSLHGWVFALAVFIGAYGGSKALLRYLIT
ncbi:MAG TPA: YeeE/YedE family protein [Oscillospiraceae bacterium]|nr:YeeE/YedE family protein [Oscillospiraceae bacterium]